MRPASVVARSLVLLGGFLGCSAPVGGDGGGDAGASGDGGALPGVSGPPRSYLLGDWNHGGAARPGVFDNEAGSLHQLSEGWGPTAYQTVEGLPHGPVAQAIWGDWWGEDVTRFGYRDTDGVVHLAGRSMPVPPRPCAGGCAADETCDDGDDDPAYHVCRPAAEVAVTLTDAGGAPITTGALVVADWDGDGDDDLGLFDAGAWWFYPDAASGRPAGAPVRFGREGDRPVAGDFDGDGTPSFGVHRAPDRFFLRDGGEGDIDGTADRCLALAGGELVASADDVPLAGDLGDRAGLVMFRPASGSWQLVRELPAPAPCDMADEPTAVEADVTIGPWNPDAPAADAGVSEVLAGSEPRLLRLPIAPDADWSAPPPWSWTPADTWSDATGRDALASLTEARLVAYGKVLLLAANYGPATHMGGVALVRVSDRASLFRAVSEHNWHSAERLPDGNVVAVASSQALVRVFDTRVTDGSRHVDYTFRSSPHGAVWDPARGVLWIWGGEGDADSPSFRRGKLVAYRYSFDRGAPALREVATFHAPYGIWWGHDLMPVPGTDRLMMSGSANGTTEFDTLRGKWIEFGEPSFTPHVKAMSMHPETGALLQVIGSSTVATSDTIHFYRPAGGGPTDYAADHAKRLPGALFYKARFYTSLPRRNGSW